MSKGRRLVKLPRCGGSDGGPRARAHSKVTDGTFRICRAVATHRIEWSTATVNTVRSGYEWDLRHREELTCDRHLPVLLEYADREVAFTRSPYRRYPTPVQVPDPALIRLEFMLNKRAAAHGRTEYVPVETLLSGPVAFTLF